DSRVNPNTTTAFSTATETARVTVTSTPPVGNHAPTLDIDPSPTLAAIAEDSVPHGDTVASLLGSAVSDRDACAQHGIAVTEVTDTTNGVWEYSLDNGGKWQRIGTVSEANALLLRDTDKVRFRPAANWNGKVSISYRAWDRTRGAAGARANLALVGVL